VIILTTEKELEKLKDYEMQKALDGKTPEAIRKAKNYYRPDAVKERERFEKRDQDHFSLSHNLFLEQFSELDLKEINDPCCKICNYLILPATLKEIKANMGSILFQCRITDNAGKPLGRCKLQKYGIPYLIFKPELSLCTQYTLNEIIRDEIAYHSRIKEAKNKVKQLKQEIKQKAKEKLDQAKAEYQEVIGKPAPGE